ncbi:hypothetical protein RUM43_002650 [Polyplax serrata]|uniref:Uncharacterized protein n=1 Tax=Polyplax serrata TaxID=468196 RepID=A0AAN8NZ39_POLSC
MKRKRFGTEPFAEGEKGKGKAKGKGLNACALAEVTTRVIRDLHPPVEGVASTRRDLDRIEITTSSVLDALNGTPRHKINGYGQKWKKKRRCIEEKEEEEEGRVLLKTRKVEDELRLKRAI